MLADPDVRQWLPARAGEEACRALKLDLIAGGDEAVATLFEAVLATLARRPLDGFSSRGVLHVLDLLTLSLASISRWHTVFATYLPFLVGDTASLAELLSQIEQLEARRAACSVVEEAWREAASAAAAPPPIVPWDEDGHGSEASEAEEEMEHRWDDPLDWDEHVEGHVPHPDDTLAQNTTPTPVEVGRLLLRLAHDATLLQLEAERKGLPAGSLSKVPPLASRFASELIKGLKEAAATKAFCPPQGCSVKVLLELHESLLPHLRGGGIQHVLEWLAEAATDDELPPPSHPPTATAPSASPPPPSTSPPPPSPSCLGAPTPPHRPPMQPPLPPPSPPPAIPPPAPPPSTLRQLAHISSPRWFCDAVSGLLQPLERAKAQRVLNEAARVAMAERAASGVARAADEATRRQFALEPVETWSPNARLAVELAEKGDVPDSMGTAARANWAHMSSAQQQSYAVVAATLRSVKGQIGAEHGAWDEAAAKEYRAVLNAIEAVMNRRLDFAGAQLVCGPSMRPRSAAAPRAGLASPPRSLSRRRAEPLCTARAV